MAQVPTHLTAYKKIRNSHCYISQRPSPEETVSSGADDGVRGEERILETLPWTLGKPLVLMST